MRACVLHTARRGAPWQAQAYPHSVMYWQRRHVRYSSIQETLQPIPGQSAGQMSIMNEISCNPDAEEERRKPVFRLEVAPLVGQPVHRPHEQHPSYLRTMYEWGYNSLTLFKKTNESPGPWWNANASTLVSNWSQVGDYANAGMWSSVWRYTYGVGEYNVRPATARGRSWGHRVAAVKPRAGTSKSTSPTPAWAVGISYDEYPPHNARAAHSRHHDDTETNAHTTHQESRTGHPSRHAHDTTPPPPALQKLCFAHTPEHDRHRRIRNPPLHGFRDLSPLHGKRILREIQYHLGQGLRFYLVDGVFGSEPSTCTPYRVITDNPTHALFLAMAALRQFNMVAPQEVCLIKRVQQSPIDEWGWRRPGVLVYHAPCYDFEAPRIVEEFGGPRPQDVGLQHRRFVALEPYSIPMKGVIGGEPSCETLLEVTAFLSARWGFYADERGLLTLPGDSLLVAPAQHGENSGVRLVMGASTSESAVLRRSPWLYGGHHHRIGHGMLARAWDVVSLCDIHRYTKDKSHDTLSADGGTAETPHHDEETITTRNESSASTPHQTTETGVSALHESSPTPNEADRRSAAPLVHVQPLDLVESSLGRVQRPLPTRMGLSTAYSHRFYHRRHVSGFGYKWPHRYSTDTATCAYAGGHLFHPPAVDELAGHMPRPRCVPLSLVDVIILLPHESKSLLREGEEETKRGETSSEEESSHSGSGGGGGAVEAAADAMMSILRARAFVYAEEHVLKKALMEMLGSVRSIRMVPAGASTQALLRDLVQGR